MFNARFIRSQNIIPEAVLIETSQQKTVAPTFGQFRQVGLN